MRNIKQKVSSRTNVKDCAKLNSRQLQAVEILSAIPTDFKSIEEVAKKVGVSRRTIYNWFDIPEFNEEISERSDRNLRRYSSLVRTAHLNGIIKKTNPALIRLYYERFEGWNPKTFAEEEENRPQPILELVKNSD